MTNATINGKRKQMTMAEKAALLQVVDIHEPGVLAVISNSDSRVGYAVYHVDFKVTRCRCTGCSEYGHTTCAYRMAAQRKLDEMRRDWYCQEFGIYA